MMARVGDQITVTVGSTFDGGFVAIYKDPLGVEYRGALLVGDTPQAVR